MSDDILQIAEKLEASSSEAAKIKEHVIAEIKRLQAMNPFRANVPMAIRLSDKLFAYGNDEEIALLQTKLTQLAAWQKIAIVERARAYWLYEQIDSNIFWDMWDRQDKSSYENEAAKELGLQVSQEAGYLERLEAAYVDMVFNAVGSDEEARAALEKIRKG